MATASERVVTDADPEYTGAPVATIEQAMQLKQWRTAFESFFEQRCFRSRMLHSLGTLSLPNKPLKLPAAGFSRAGGFRQPPSVIASRGAAA